MNKPRRATASKRHELTAAELATVTGGDVVILNPRGSNDRLSPLPPPPPP
jgi:hypothetical protein